MKYGPEKTAEIAGLLKNGNNRTDSCLLADISYETFTVWMEKPEFSEAIKKAEATCKARNIQIIQKAAITTWQAAAWWLERKYWQEFAQRHEEIGDKEGTPKRLAERAAQLLKQLEKRNEPVRD